MPPKPRPPAPTEDYTALETRITELEQKVVRQQATIADHEARITALEGR